MEEEVRNKERNNAHFLRIEKKFWMSQGQYKSLQPLLNKYMRPDEHGLSDVNNIYCDSDDYYLIRRSIERPNFKEKLRIRSYGQLSEDKLVFVEIKRKVDGIGYKRRIRIPFKDVNTILNGEKVNSENPQIEKEILEFVERYHPLPKVLISYNRLAMYAKKDDDFRVTIDTDLKYQLVDKDFNGVSDLKNMMDDDDKVLMEIKATGGIPKWLYKELSRLGIYQAPFSKIGTCFNKHIVKELKF